MKTTNREIKIRVIQTLSGKYDLVLTVSSYRTDILTGMPKTEHCFLATMSSKIAAGERAIKLAGILGGTVQEMELEGNL